MKYVAIWAVLAVMFAACSAPPSDAARTTAAYINETKPRATETAAETTVSASPTTAASTTVSVVADATTSATTTTAATTTAAPAATTTAAPAATTTAAVPSTTMPAAAGIVLKWPQVAEEIDAEPYIRPRWTSAVDRHLRWRQPDCKWAFYASSAQPDCFSDPNRDHLVAVAEALDSGLELFYLKDFYLNFDNLYVMPGDENRRKSDHDPAGWLPEKNVCRYVAEWVGVKNKYELTVDVQELAEMQKAVSGCYELTATAAPTTAAPTTAPAAAPTAAPVSSGEEEWARFKKLGCGEWPGQGKSITELRTMVKAATAGGFDWGSKDRNNDVYPCETQLGKKCSY